MSLLFVPFSAARTDDLQGVFARRVPELVALALQRTAGASYRDWFVPGTSLLLLAAEPVPDALLRSMARDGERWVVSGRLTAERDGGTWSIRAVAAADDAVCETAGVVTGSWAAAVDTMAAWCSGLAGTASVALPSCARWAGDGVALRELFLDLEACAVAAQGGARALDQVDRLWRHLDRARAAAPDAQLLAERHAGRAAWLHGLAPALSEAWRREQAPPASSAHQLSTILGRLGVSWPPTAP